MQPDPFTRLEARTLVVRQSNIDTDQIIPARFLTTTTREGLGVNAFYDWRYTGDDQPKNASPFPVAGAGDRQVLVAGPNFGCGSSREHAAWAIGDLGIRAVIAPSYSDIFSGNAVKNGILPVVLPQEAVDRLMEVASGGDDIHIDLEAQTVTTQFQDRFTFEIDTFRKHCLLGGLDEVSLTLESKEAISIFEADRDTNKAWLMEGTGA